jgi:uncharacterized membrane protein YdjX (TVP38/TMEM64 family)
MNVNLKLILIFTYILCFGALFTFLFSYLDFKDLTDFYYIKKNSEAFLEYRKNNLLLFTSLFLLISIFWIFFLGLGSPVAIISGFVFGQWYGTLISTISLTVGSTLLYIFVRSYFHHLVLDHLEKKIKNYKNLFKKNELFYFTIFRLAGGAGIPFPIQNILPIVFNMRIKNYFCASFFGLVPSLFIANTLGSGVEKMIGKNESLSYINIIFNPGIYWPIIGFIAILVASFFIREKFFKK